MNNDEPAGQVVFHAHIHIIPRFKNDSGYHGVKYEYEDDEAEEIARNVLEKLS